MDNELNITKHRDDDAVVRALTVCTSFVLPMALNAAIQLNVFDIVNKCGDGAQLTASEIASQLPTSSVERVEKLECLLRLLACNSFFICSTTNLGDGKVRRCYGLGPVGKCFVGDDTLAPFQSLCLSVKLKYQFYIKDAILEGGDIFKKYMGASVFDYTKINPEFGEMFGDAVVNHSSVIMKKVLKVYKGFGGLTSLVNVGGGYGVALDMIVSKYPSIHGINFDLPEVIQNAPPYKGIKHVGGDMFVGVPRGDAIFLKKILHKWNDDLCVSLLKKCYKSLPNKGKLIVMDCILPDFPKSDLHSKYIYQMDVLMASTFRAKERTKEEFKSLAKRAGFYDFKAICYVYGLWVMEFIKS